MLVSPFDCFLPAKYLGQRRYVPGREDQGHGRRLNMTLFSDGAQSPMDFCPDWGKWAYEIFWSFHVFAYVNDKPALPPPHFGHFRCQMSLPFAP